MSAALHVTQGALRLPQPQLGGTFHGFTCSSRAAIVGSVTQEPPMLASKPRHVRTKHLDIELRADGDGNAGTVLLLHGWPDDATTWDHIAPELHRAGHRTIAPMHRGFGKTRLRNSKARRTGNAGILAIDAIELMDALESEQFYVAGHDWGSSTAEALAVGWPKRVMRLAMISTPSRIGGLKMPDFEQAARFWYQWLQTTKKGEEAIRKDPKGFARTAWTMWSPPGWFDAKTFEAVAQSFSNPDWVDVTLNSYRARWGEDKVDPRSAKLEEKIRKTKRIATPTLFIQGEKDGVTPPSQSDAMHKKFSGSFTREVLSDVGHFPTREAPGRVAELLVNHFGERT
jgi:pimeloyl-ACP methyl ester carboxylesterase